MSKKSLLATSLIAAAATMSSTTAADAAVPIPSNLTSVAVTGPTGTVWNTTVDGYYTLFLQSPIGTTLNPNDQAINKSTALGANNFAIFGDGWPSSGFLNSDSTYNIKLGFANGATLTGSYVPTTGIFTGGSSVDANYVRYTLTGFGWQRIPFFNAVSPFSAASGGNGSDYAGGFSFLATALPEVATWAMMILGMGMMGASLRYRRRSAKVTFA